MNLMLRKPSAFVPLLMSLGALAVIGLHLVLAGPAPQQDEGTAAHVWQLLMGLQVPVILYFAARWLPESPRPAGAVLALQLGAAIAALAPVFLLHW